MQGRIQFDMNTPLVPPYGRIVYDYTNPMWITVQQPDITQKIKLNKTDTIATRFEVFPLVERKCGSLQPLHKTEYDDIYIIYEYGFDMHTGQKATRKKDKFDDAKFIRIKPEQIISERTRYEDEDNKQYYYGFVHENTHLNMKMDLYMSNIYSRISLQAIEFYSQICEQTRNLRQLTITQVQKDTPLLGYILTGDRSTFFLKKKE